MMCASARTMRAPPTRCAASARSTGSGPRRSTRSDVGAAIRPRASANSSPPAMSPKRSEERRVGKEVEIAVGGAAVKKKEEEERMGEHEKTRQRNNVREIED